MEAVLNVRGIAYCKIEIEDANMPPSFNLIDHIVIQEGFGISVPTMTLYLFDQTGTLQTDMNLVQGTKCSISITRDSQSDTIEKRTFSLWGMKRGVTNEGPHLQVTFILDVPKWSAGVYCENFRSTSSGAMSQIASRAGLRYSGPSGTDDNMNWLNINTTRSSFSEDVAMRGYAGQSSCMARVLTMDSELRYKDLFAELQGQEKANLLLNMDEEGVNPYPVKETQESTLSGVMAHWFNYGQIQHEHSLNGNGQQKTESITAPILGDALPISDRVKGLISDAVAGRVTYTGLDTGTEPKPQSNLHQYYERALYQNLRSLGLFSEKVRVLLTVPTDVFSFDCVKYNQRDPIGHRLEPSKALNGKWLVGGKTIRIKNGHVYSEVLDLLRPYISNTGQSKAAGASNGGRVEEANEGPFDLTEGTQQELTEQPAASASEPVPVEPPASEVDQAQTLMDNLEVYDQTNPSIPSVPLPSAGGISSGSQGALAQINLRDTLKEIQRVDNEISNIVEASKAGFTPEDLRTVKRISESVVKTSANSTISALKDHLSSNGSPASGIEGLASDVQESIAVALDKPILDRFTAKASEIKDQVFESVVSTVSGASTAVGDVIGDIQKGGIFSEDFNVNGLTAPIDAARNVVDAIEQEINKGANFVFPASKFGLGADDVAIGPKQVAEFLVDYAEQRKDPQAFLAEKGAEAYQAAFGTKPPGDAREAIRQLKDSAEKVSGLFGDSELLLDGINAASEIAENRNVQTLLDSDASRSDKLNAARDALLSDNPDLTVKIPGIDASASINASDIAREVIQRGGDTDYSQQIDFKFGENGVAPLVETVVDKARHGSTSDADIIETVREAVSWAEYTRIGSNEAQEAGMDDIFWEFPHSVPYTVMEEGEGDAHDLSDSPSGF